MPRAAGAAWGRVGALWAGVARSRPRERAKRATEAPGHLYRSYLLPGVPTDTPERSRARSRGPRRPGQPRTQNLLLREDLASIKKKHTYMVHPAYSNTYITQKDTGVTQSIHGLNCVFTFQTFF